MAEINYLQLTLDLVPWIVAYVLITLSLNLEYGYTGIPNFGKVLAVAAGAFFAGSLSGLMLYYILGLNTKYDFYDNHIAVMDEINRALRNDAWLSIGSLIAMLIIATLAGALFGFIGSYPAIRLREDYLGMTLLAMGEILVIFGYTYERFVGGTLGIFIPSFLGFIPLDSRPYVRLAIYIGIGLAIYFIVRKFVNSPLGRVLRAIRDNESLASSLGKDIVSYRKKVMVYAGAIAGLAGGLLILQAGAVIASSYTRYLYTFLPWIMIIVGGTANNLGATLGAIVFVVSNRLIDTYKAELQGFLPFSVVWLTPIILSIILILMLMFRPQGLIPEKETKTLSEKEILEILNKYSKKK